MVKLYLIKWILVTFYHDTGIRVSFLANVGYMISEENLNAIFHNFNFQN